MTLNDVYSFPDGKPFIFCGGCKNEAHHSKTSDKRVDQYFTLMVFTCTACGFNKSCLFKTSRIKRK